MSQDRIDLRLDRIGIAIEGEATLVAEAAAALPRFARAPAQDRPALRVCLSRTDPCGRPQGLLVFDDGARECRSLDEDLLLWDGASRARIAAGGASIDLGVHGEISREGRSLLIPSIALALRFHGFAVIHSATLVTPDGRGVLIIGPQGAGKSTLTIALLEAGCRWAGDDGAFVDLDARRRVVAVPRHFHLAPRTAAAFPRFAPLLMPLTWNEKQRLDPERAWPGRGLEAVTDPSVVLLPRVSHTPATTVEPTGRTEALGAMMEASTSVAVPGLPRIREQMEALGRVAEGVRPRSVLLGRDLLEDPGKVATRVLAAI